MKGMLHIYNDCTIVKLINSPDVVVVVGVVAVIGIVVSLVVLFVHVLDVRRQFLS